MRSGVCGMSRAGVELLLYLLDEAFEGNREHALLANLRDVTAEDWSWLPADGGRSVRDLAGHVGACKYMYENHAFGDGTLTWTDPLVNPPLLSEAAPAMKQVIEWIREGHRRFRSSVAALDDDELARPRPTNWGALCETRWIISVIIEHDLYHAGEINHLRALRHRNDRWPWQQG
jgi:hypothetical protein